MCWDCISNCCVLLCSFFTAYREPHFYYQFTARYHSAPCNSIYNISFENKLLQILSKLVHEIKCEVSLQKSECHHVKMQKAGFQNELFFKFAGKNIQFSKEYNLRQEAHVKTCESPEWFSNVSVIT